VARDGESDPRSSSRQVELMGTPEQISRAEQLVKDVIAEVLFQSDVFFLKFPEQFFKKTGMLLTQLLLLFSVSVTGVTGILKVVRKRAMKFQFLDT
jgi:hypothetical protein